MKSEFMEALHALFNWKKNPASVFIFAIPLALIGLGSCFLVAYLQWKVNGDPVYALIVSGGMLLLGFGLWPLYKMHRINERIKALART